MLNVSYSFVNDDPDVYIKGHYKLDIIFCGQKFTIHKKLFSDEIIDDTLPIGTQISRKFPYIHPSVIKLGNEFSKNKVTLDDLIKCLKEYELNYYSAKNAVYRVKSEIPNAFTKGNDDKVIWEIANSLHTDDTRELY